MGALAVLKSGGEAAGVIPELHARKQGAHWHRPVGCVCRVAGRVWDAGGVLRGGDVDAAWTAREAMRNP